MKTSGFQRNIKIFNDREFCPEKLTKAWNFEIFFLVCSYLVQTGIKTRKKSRQQNGNIDLMCNFLMCTLCQKHLYKGNVKPYDKIRDCEQL